MNIEDVRLSEKYLEESSAKFSVLDALTKADEDACLEGERCPERKEFVALYSYLRKINAEGIATVSVRRTASVLRSEQRIDVSATAVALILNVFFELGLLNISKFSDDLYEILFPKESKKVDLSESKLLDRYRKSCARGNRCAGEVTTYGN